MNIIEFNKITDKIGTTSLDAKQIEMIDKYKKKCNVLVVIFLLEAIMLSFCINKMLMILLSAISIGTMFYAVYLFSFVKRKILRNLKINKRSV